MSEGPEKSIKEITKGFSKHGYICSKQIATAVYLASQLEKPILIEGPPGVGKTELANTAALHFEKEIIRLQCYEGLDESKALYEWRYGKQLLYTQILKEQMQEVLEGAKGLKESLGRLMKFEDIFFSEDFLESRPLLKALTSDKGSVLLIDEVDKSDEEFEALLLEILSEFQIILGVSLEDTQKKLDKALKRNLEGSVKSTTPPAKPEEPEAPEIEPTTDTED